MPRKTWDAWTAEEEKFVRDHPDMSAAELYSALGGNHGTVNAYRQKRIWMREQDEAAAKLIRTPASAKETLNEEVVIKRESAVVITDVHIPFQNAPFIDKVLNLGESWGITTLIIGGDLLDIGAYSKFVGDPADILEKEFEDAEKFFDVVTPHFDKIVWTMGNHEARALGKQFNREVKVNRFVRMITSSKVLETSSYEHCTLEPPSIFKECGCRFPDRYPWKIVHPMSASIVAGRVPALIASRRFTSHHVVGAHGHLIGVVRTEDGLRWAVDSGCTLQIDKIDYSIKRVGLRPAMVNGAVLLVGQQPYQVTPDTNFSAMRGMYSNLEQVAA